MAISKFISRLIIQVMQMTCVYVILVIVDSFKGERKMKLEKLLIIGVMSFALAGCSGFMQNEYQNQP